VLQCVALCCSVLQCFAVCCSVLQSVAVCVLRCVAVFFFVAPIACCRVSVLHCVAVCRRVSVLHCGVVRDNVVYWKEFKWKINNDLQCNKSFKKNLEKNLLFGVGPFRVR